MATKTRKTPETAAVPEAETPGLLGAKVDPRPNDHYTASGQFAAEALAWGQPEEDGVAGGAGEPSVEGGEDA